MVGIADGNVTDLEDVVVDVGGFEAAEGLGGEEVKGRGGAELGFEFGDL